MDWWKAFSCCRNSCSSSWLCVRIIMNMSSMYHFQISGLFDCVRRSLSSRPLMKVLANDGAILYCKCRSSLFCLIFLLQIFKHQLDLIANRDGFQKVPHLCIHPRTTLRFTFGRLSHTLMSIIILL